VRQKRHSLRLCQTPVRWMIQIVKPVNKGEL